MQTLNSQILPQTLDGFVSANRDAYEMVSGVQAVKVKNQTRGKVSLVVCGCSVREAALPFLLGENLADALVFGDSFRAPPDPYSIMRTAISIRNDKGILFLCSYEEAERMKFLEACGLLDEANIDSEVVFVWDDVASGTEGQLNTRRAGAGIFFCTKIAGAAAACGLPLKDAYRITKEARNYTYSISAGVPRERIPPAANSLFEMSNELAYGIGRDGEPGILNPGHHSAEEIVNRMTFCLLSSSRLRKGDTVCAYINGFGGTGFTDLSILGLLLRQILEERGIRIHDMVVNPVVSQSESLGVTVSLMQANDELLKFYDMSCQSLYFRKNG